MPTAAPVHEPAQWSRLRHLVREMRRRRARREAHARISSCPPMMKFCLEFARRSGRQCLTENLPECGENSAAILQCCNVCDGRLCGPRSQAACSVRRNEAHSSAGKFQGKNGGAKGSRTPDLLRSEERRVGKEGGSTGRYRWSQ